MKTKYVTIFGFLALMTMGLLSCQKESAYEAEPANLRTASVPASGSELIPVIIPGENPGGNRTCAEVATFFNTTFENTSGTMEGEDRLAGTVGPISWTTDPTGTYITWTSTVPVKAAFIVKGGPNANIYYYADCTTGDTNLASPMTQGGTIAQLSNLTICWTVCPPPDPCFWVDESAWSAGPRYVSRGNWATYTAYTGVETTVNLFAGQVHLAGTVTFTPVGNQVQITISLNDGFRLREIEGVVVGEAVKIQGYSARPPASNPAPGLFTTYKGTDLVVTVNSFNFYGVHLDLDRRVCPE